MTYDAASRHIALADWTGLYTSTFDANGRPLSIVNPAGVLLTYNYDAAGQRVTLSQPTGTFTYVFD